MLCYPFRDSCDLNIVNDYSGNNDDHTDQFSFCNLFPKENKTEYKNEDIP